MVNEEKDGIKDASFQVLDLTTAWMMVSLLMIGSARGRVAFVRGRNLSLELMSYMKDID